MRAVIQRVKEATVTVEGETVGRIGHGLLVLLGVGHSDTHDVAHSLAEKTAGLRIFEDADKKTNLSLLDVGGAALVVSQFTLYADTRKGRRPSFTDAADPRLAEGLVETFRQALEASGVPTAAGRFGAHMEVSLVNDGPFTLVLDSRSSPKGGR
jgi:D-tyrosyl-tRNA(Tyr) deacylase